jgi:hypothetical protein
MEARVEVLVGGTPASAILGAALPRNRQKHRRGAQKKNLYVFMASG